MSIWYNIGEGEIRGLDYDTETPTVTIGVALSWYDCARIAIRNDDDGGTDNTILLDVDTMRQLAALLIDAADRCQSRDPIPGKWPGGYE